jgi:GNAT superfamily N-acetyltransferase
VDGKVVASALSIIVNYRKYGDNHTFQEITGDYTFSTHDANGDVLYGIEMFVHPDYRGLRLGRRLYDARKELCENLNLRAVIAGGRIPNYKNFSEGLTPREYIEKVKLKGYFVRIVYVFLESPEDCIQRIRLRVKLGGHFIPNEDVIRRYYRSKANFWNIYKNLADSWVIIYNSSTEEPQKVAVGTNENFVVELENMFDDFLNDLGK